MKICRMTECRAGDIRWFDYGPKNPKDKTRVCQGWRPVIVMATFYRTVTFIPLTTSEKFDVCGVSLGNITEDDNAVVYPRFDLITTVTENDLARPPHVANQYLGNIRDNYPDSWKILVNFYKDMLLGDIRYEDLVCKKRHELLANEEPSVSVTEKVTPMHVDAPVQEPVTIVPETVEVPETKPEPKTEIVKDKVVKTNRTGKCRSLKLLIAEVGKDDVIAIISDSSMTNAEKGELLGCSTLSVIKLKKMLDVSLRTTKPKKKKDTTAPSNNTSVNTHSETPSATGNARRISVAPSSAKHDRQKTAKELLTEYGSFFIMTQMKALDKKSFGEVYNCSPETTEELYKNLLSNARHNRKLNKR